MNSYINKINEQFSTISIDNNFVEIKTGLEFKKGIALRVFLKRIDGKIYLSDNKNTLRYMNTVYQLDASDVKNCINDVVNFYKVRIDKGELCMEVNIENVKTKFSEFLACMFTLANMYLFFDEPN